MLRTFLILATLCFSQTALLKATSIIEVLQEDKTQVKGTGGSNHQDTYRTLEQDLLYTTVRIEMRDPDDHEIRSAGTGFFAKINEKDQGSVKGKESVFLVSNKHVVEGNNNMQIFFHMVLNKQNKICKASFPAGFVQTFTSYRDYDVCSICIDPLIYLLEYKSKGTLIYKTVNFSDLIYSSYKNKAANKSSQWNNNSVNGPNPVQKEGFTAFSQVKMVGYPNGMLDSVNNLPIVRQGSVATDPECNYETREEYLVDIAVFPGSSGSPLFMTNTKQKIDSPRRGSPLLNISQHVFFVGLIRAGYTHTSEATMEELVGKSYEKLKRFSQEHAAKRQKGHSTASSDMDFTQTQQEIQEIQAATASILVEQFSNLAVAIKPEIVRQCIINATQEDVAFSNIKYFVGKSIAALNEGNYEKVGTI